MEILAAASKPAVGEPMATSVALKDTLRLPVAYWKAGIAEYWLMDARGEDLLFHVYQRGAAAYEPAASDPEGFQHSAVFRNWFRLSRRRDRRGDWVFNLERKSP